MQFDLVIRQANLVTSNHSEVSDVGVLGGKIAAIGDLGSASAIETIDASGLTMIPGGIDTQVHFREPGLEHKEDLATGTLSALYGGITSILEMPNTNPTTTTEEALLDKLARAKGRAWCHYGFFVGASRENADQLGHLENLPGTPGVKIFMGSSTGPLLVGDDDDVRRVLMNGKKRCPVHAEDEAMNRAASAAYTGHDPKDHPYIRDAESAVRATTRLLALAESTGRPVHVLHISTAQEPIIISEAKAKGIDATCEVSPQHLWFAGPELYERLGTLGQINPPIRDASHREGLWKALHSGMFDVFGSDHAPHTLEEKAREYPKSPSGMPGVQTMLPVLLTFVAQGKLDMHTLVRMLCEKPADLYNIHGKGKLEVGADADLTLVDPSRSYIFERSMVKSRCGWSTFEGETLTGSVESVILNGKIALRDGEAVGVAAGQMLSFA